jgi:hypothetical protein
MGGEVGVKWDYLMPPESSDMPTQGARPPWSGSR